MAVHSMGAPLMSQICPLARLRLQPANDYLALGGSVILQHAHKIRQAQDKKVGHTDLPTTLLHRKYTLIKFAIIERVYVIINIITIQLQRFMSEHLLWAYIVYYIMWSSGFKYIWAVFKWQTSSEFNLTKCGLFPPGEPAVTRGSTALCYAMCFVKWHLKDVCEPPFLSEPAVHLRLKYQHAFPHNHPK